MSVSLAYLPPSDQGTRTRGSRIRVLSHNACLPWGRHWAVTHDRTQFDPSQQQWVACANIMRGVKLPQLIVITPRFDEASGTLVLSHPAQPDLSFSPAEPAGGGEGAG